MTATVETPLVPGPIQGPTREEPMIEALLLDEYRSLAHLAYLILPPAFSRARRIAAAHRVVQRAVPPGLPVPDREPREFLRSRVVQEATRQAACRSLLDRAGGVFAPADALGFDPCSVELDRTAIAQRIARGRRIAVAATAVLAIGLFAALLFS
ncbi:hypothetical protein HPO96_36575 [Kribbella sandramycini]|uniref:Uncharacterized protein n=1 Tax=Kribbella sandramycini TaxID=60450 RepID=A0A7Y4L7E1_9ACTN|nr:hypothetical protein [Kribbella sandramycini]MBB6567238.1 hypothetical protein [Kribbella sandramycini]NOL45775.1 hypothetical protein [Kribbella sandramycini]